MSEKQKIKISVADRIYPLTIHPSQEEGLRKAAKKIEEVIKQFEQSYAVRDKQDVLAMCALQLAAKTEQETINNNQEAQEVEGRLRKLNDVLKSYIG